jgi:anti-sigma B factor antagonist
MSADRTPILEVQIDRQPQLTVASCAGKVVIETWPQLSTALRELIPEGRPIRVDLAKVDWVDSVGIGAFVSVWASAKKAGCDLKFRNPSKLVQDVVELTQLYDLFEKQAS